MNRVRRSLVMTEGRLIEPEDLGLRTVIQHNDATTLARVREAAEKEAIRLMLERTGHNLSQSADNLGISRATLYRLIQKYQLA